MLVMLTFLGIASQISNHQLTQNDPHSASFFSENLRPMVKSTKITKVEKGLLHADF